MEVKEAAGTEGTEDLSLPPCTGRWWQSVSSQERMPLGRFGMACGRACSVDLDLSSLNTETVSRFCCAYAHLFVNKVACLLAKDADHLHR